MKIILCIFLLYITAVSVFGEPQELNGIVGESVKFPAEVKIEGKLMHSGVTIGDVISGRFTPPRDGEFIGRVQWDSSTGLFSLSGLRLKDSGIYTVQDTQQTSVSTFNLTVWEDNVPVSKPHVSITHNEYPCTIECTAERGTGVTLSWYREDEKKPYVSSRVASAPYLHLPETVERSGTYTCEVKNSVSNEKASITVEAHCTAGPSAGTVVAIIIAVVAVLIAVVFAVLFCRVRIIRLDEQAALQDAVRKTIQGNQGLIKDAVRKTIQGNQGLIKDAVRRIIQDNQALPQYDIRRLIQVIKLLDNIVAPTSDEDRQAFIHDGVRRIRLVKDILDKVDPRAYQEEMKALRSNVQDILDKVDPRSLYEDKQALLQDDDEDKQALLQDDAVKRIRLDVQDILDKVDPRSL